MSYSADCPRCGQRGKIVPAGVSKKTGNSYDAFLACDTCKNGDRNLTWKSEAQWQYHADVAERDRRTAARAAAPATAYVRPADDIKPGERRAPATHKSAPATPKKAAPAKKTAVKRPPSDAVLKIIYANKVIEALNALEAPERIGVLTANGYDPKREKSYVLYVNGLDYGALNDFGGSLGVGDIAAQPSQPEER